MSLEWGDVEEYVDNRSLGLPPTDVEKIGLHIGPCELGEQNKIYYIDRFTDVRTMLGEGILTDKLEDAQDMGASTMIAVVSEADVDGTVGAVTAGSGNKGKATFAVDNTSAPKSRYQFKVQIVQGGDFEEATYKWSKDGGDSWSPEYTTPMSATAVNLGTTGVKVKWTTGGQEEFVAGDYWEFETTAPASSISAIQDALGFAWEKVNCEFVHIACPVGSGSFATVAQWMQDARDAHKPMFAIIEAPFPEELATPPNDLDAYVTELISYMAGFSSDDVSVFAGGAELLTNKTESIIRGGSGILAGILGVAPVMREPGRTDKFPITKALRIAPYYKGEWITEGALRALAMAGYTVFRRYVGKPNIFINRWLNAADKTSNYRKAVHRRVENKIVRICRLGALNWLQREIYDDGEGGERSDFVKTSLSDMENYIEGMIDAAMINKPEPELIKFKLTIPKNQDIIGTDTINCFAEYMPVKSAGTISIYFALRKKIETTA